MGLLDGLLGGVVAAGLVGVVSNIVEKHGGVGGLAKEFEAKGLGGAMQSWIGKGKNEEVTPEQIHHALGADTLKDMAAKFGLSTDDLTKKLAQVLPQAVDKLTPDGVVPHA